MAVDLDLSVQRDRRRARWHVFWHDHGMLRGLWHNRHEIAPGVWRSNYPSRRRLRGLKKEGFRTILNLRGAGGHLPYALERRVCDRLGLTLESVALASRKAPHRGQLRKLVDLMRRVEKPVLIHCKSGADRAGLASAIYLHVIEGKSLTLARQQLSWRNLHFRFTKTGVLDLFLDTYEARHAATGISFDEWLENEYDADALQAAFEKGRR